MYERLFIYFNMQGRRFPRRVNATVPSPEIYGSSILRPGRVAGAPPVARVGSMEVEEGSVLHLVDGNRALAVHRHEVVVVRPRCQLDHLAGGRQGRHLLGHEAVIG